MCISDSYCIKALHTQSLPDIHPTFFLCLTTSRRHLRQCGFGLGQPEGHVHGTVQVDSGGQDGAGLRTTASLAVQLAHPEVAVGYERAHAEYLGQGQCLLVVGFSLHDIGRVGVGLDDAKLVQRLRLEPASLPLPGQVERLAGLLRRALSYHA
jgi:hypothetical protein